MKLFRVLKIAAGIAASGAVAAAVLPKDEAAPAGQASSVRRLTQGQYRLAIADIFGDDIKIVGRFEPDLRRDGLIAVGASSVSVTPAGFEQYDQMARGIAAQVLDAKHRQATVPCTPRVPTKPDDGCASKFGGKYGRLLFRRPLTRAEDRMFVAMANDGAKSRNDFYAGLETSLAAMLVAPNFIFRVETGKPASDGGPTTLDGFGKASRLSFLLWDSAPDDELLDAAAKGGLDTDAGLGQVVDRMIASPKFERGTRAFFSDLLALEGFDQLQKDAEIYPKFNARVATDAREQTLQLVTDLLLRKKADYRELFTTRTVFLSRALGPIYNIPVFARSGWEAHELPPSDPRQGILSQMAFMMLHSHPGRSSPTLRGKAVRETFLCQEVPAPPANVNFSVVQDTKNPLFKTARARLAAHNTEPMCASCHKLMDPIGLPFESLDSVGGFRTSENGAVIDSSGEYKKLKFTGPVGVGAALHNDPALTSCLVSRAFSYGYGRVPAEQDENTVESLEASFQRNGFRFPDLMRSIVLDPHFYQLGTAAKHAPVVTTSARAL